MLEAIRVFADIIGKFLKSRCQFNRSDSLSVGIKGHDETLINPSLDLVAYCPVSESGELLQIRSG
jgi:hypothetical protein